MRAMVWFRADLRTRDNPALRNACASATRGVIAAFTVCPDQWRQHDWGTAKVDFLLRNLAELSASLEKLRIPLLVARATGFDGVGAELLKLAERHKCDALYLNREYEVNELRRDERVTSIFEASGRSVLVFDDQCIITPGDLLTNQGEPYTVFTPFSKKWIEVCKTAGVTAVPQPKRQPALPGKPSKVPTRLSGFGKSPCADHWPAGEKRAHAVLRKFIRGRIDTYDKYRDLPAIEGTSTLSPYLALGVVSPRQCLLGAMEANNGRLAGGKRGVATWISELIWREFYRHILVAFPRVGMHRAFKPETEHIKWNHDEKRFRAWCDGRTGFPIVDAGMRQLLQAGWMHNRVRMIAAMFLTKDLLIDWRWGERHFMQHLVDGDLASNNGGWQWAASTGTDAAPYFRIFNPFTQSRRFDPEGVYIRGYVPELRDLCGDAVHEPCKSGVPVNLDYPEPIVDHAAARESAIKAFASARPKRR